MFYFKHKHENKFQTLLLRVIKSITILTCARHLGSGTGGQPRPAAPSISCRQGLPAGAVPRARGPVPGLAWHPPAQGFLPGFHPDFLPSPNTRHQSHRPPVTPARERSGDTRCAGAPDRACPVPRTARGPPPAPAGPRSPLSPPASASSSARALGAAATSPQVHPAAGGRCDPAERGPRGAGGRAEDG
ncbi:U1 small nuclear ribonucleoprotein C-2-like [Corvus kubaryi]|uniref:U1 small nuclear ribonucleoprotein C-2-like n=1 Tax=Corvus kubaryi TaxID=68294 RepID=UPI001C047B5A|nr:U1 small nuclear ribonucleoprotein C-2-like [Corvus kubaryi]